MFKSLLNAPSNLNTDALILDIFIIIGVVVAGALILYFLWEAVSAITRKDSADEPLNLESKKSDKNASVVKYSIDAQPVKEETVVEETVVTEVNEEKAQEEQAAAQAEVDEEERANAERRAYLEARRQELIRRMQAEMEENEEKQEEEQEPAEETTVEEKVNEEPVDALADEREALANEKARYETMVKELEEAKRNLAEQKAEPVREVVTTTVVQNLSLDELKARLADAEENLRVTEKEFKQCKKEYTPLRRVWATHERDERKLRRKEALVAKQKVLLYGVNNYADIDEEKAKKLAEDLDLLDGLKLSVQHCEEVMKKNEERYPLLEKMYNVLSRRNDELKKDIDFYRAEIERIESEQDNND